MVQNKNRFVDFKQVKAQVSIQQVLEHYGTFADLTGRGTQLRGTCPIHAGENERQFTVNLDKNIWHCFGDCKTGGNILDFVAAKEECGIRQAALEITDWFGISTDKPASEPKKTASVKKSKKAASAGPEKCGDETAGKQQSNQPLSFDKLKNIEHDHEALAARGLFADTAEHFGVGYCTRGLMRGLIAIPVHDADGQLLAYAGATVDDPTAPYKWPDRFHAGLELYNLHRAVRSEWVEKNGYIVVTDFFDVFQLYESGRDNVVALMGSVLSEVQLEKIADLPNPARTFIVCVRPDEAEAEVLAGRLARIGYVHILASEALDQGVVRTEPEDQAA